MPLKFCIGSTIKMNLNDASILKFYFATSSHDERKQMAWNSNDVIYYYNIYVL